MITALGSLASQLGCYRVVMGTKIPHPCGDPELTAEQDHHLRREIVLTALNILETEISEPIVVTPNPAFTSG